MPDAWQLFVGGLPPQTGDYEIRQVFEGQGNILEVRVNPKNFAFVVFDSPEPVQKIMAIRETFQVNGKRLNIELKRPSSMRSGPRSATLANLAALPHDESARCWYRRSCP